MFVYTQYPICLFVLLSIFIGLTVDLTQKQKWISCNSMIRWVDAVNEVSEFSHKSQIRKMDLTQGY